MTVADIVSSATRSRMMSGIRGRDTKPEIQLRQMLHRAGFRFRLQVRTLPGCPDIVLPRYRAAVFAHGCFWHGHSCHLFRLPATRANFWAAKIARNRTHDNRALAGLSSAGWRTATVWECALKGRDRLDPDTLRQLLTFWIRSEEPILEIPVATESFRHKS